MSTSSRRPVRLLAGLPLAFSLVVALVAAPSTALAAEPANDDFADATAIAALPASIAGDTTDATTQAGEQEDPCVGPAPETVWYRITPAFTGAVRLDTDGSTAETGLSIWSGATVGSATLVECNSYRLVVSGSDPHGSLTLAVTKGKRLMIRITTTSPGAFALHAKRVTPPANDLIGAATTLPATTASLSISNRTATRTASDPVAAPCPELGSSRWYAVTPTKTRYLQADTQGTPFDTEISVFRTTSTGKRVAVACSDDTDATDGSGSLLVWKATKGVRYLIAVGGYRSQIGTLTVHLGPAARVANDDFATASALGSGDQAIDAATTYASAQPGEHASCDPTTRIAASVWYTWTPSTTGQATVGSDSLFAIYTGSSLGGLHELACGYDSTATPAVVAGTTYRVRVWWESGGAYAFHLTLKQPS